MCLGLATALLVLSGVVRAANVYGAFTFGTTSITSSGCSADAYGVIPTQLDINNGDNVLIDYNASWSDTRSSPASSATHYFNMTVSYTRATGDQWADHTAITTGSSSGSWPMQITVSSVREGESITVILLAKVTNNGCSPNPTSDTASGTIQLT